MLTEITIYRAHMRYLPTIALTICANTFAECPDYLNTSMRKLHSNETVNFCDQFGGQPMLIVNTASHCGFTKQLKGLEEIHQKYSRDNLAVIGFTSDDFWQGADSEAEAANICYVNYGVTFTMISLSSVRGKNANQIFSELAKHAGGPTWNFNKYLVDRHGSVIARYGSRTAPNSEKLLSSIEALLY